MDDIKMANDKQANDQAKVTQVQLIYNLLNVTLLCYIGTHPEHNYTSSTLRDTVLDNWQSKDG